LIPDKTFEHAIEAVIARGWLSQLRISRSFTTDIVIQEIYRIIDAMYRILMTFDAFRPADTGRFTAAMPIEALPSEFNVFVFIRRRFDYRQWPPLLRATLGINDRSCFLEPMKMSRTPRLFTSLISQKNSSISSTRLIYFDDICAQFPLRRIMSRHGTCRLGRFAAFSYDYATADFVTKSFILLTKSRFEMGFHTLRAL
jgi:hypothetical protein